jgi:drug/metabolite transporter (DMT)-like permease
LSTSQSAAQVPLRAVLAAIAAWQIIPLMDGLAKYLSDFYPILQLVWARFFFHFLLVFPVLIMRGGLRALQVARPVLQILRGGFLLVATLCFFAGIHYVPLADAVAVVFLSPLFVLLLAAAVLGERVGARHIVAVLLGLVGVLIIHRPGFGDFHWASLLVLGAALSFAAFIVSTRALAGSAPPMTTLAYQSLLGLVLMSVIAPFIWVTPTSNHWLMMFGIGLAAAVGHLLLIKAYELGSASKLAPLSYTEMVAAIIIGYFAFDDFPDLMDGIGIALIIGVSLYATLPGRGNKA